MTEDPERQAVRSMRDSVTLVPAAAFESLTLAIRCYTVYVTAKQRDRDEHNNMGTTRADLMNGNFWGNSIPQIKMAALDRARELYGPQAELQIEDIGTDHSANGYSHRFFADVEVRCMNYSEDMLPDVIEVPDGEDDPPEDDTGTDPGTWQDEE